MEGILFKKSYDGFRWSEVVLKDERVWKTEWIEANLSVASRRLVVIYMCVCVLLPPPQKKT